MKHQVNSLYEGTDSEKKSYKVTDLVIKKITDGVHMIYIDFNKRGICFDGLGCGENEHIYFGDENEILIDVVLFDYDLVIFGEMSKTHYNGIIYKHDKYCEILEG